MSAPAQPLEVLATKRRRDGGQEPAPALDIRGLTVSYHHQPVLRHVMLSVPRGHLVAIVGPNGAGKSTLLKAILGLVTPDAGAIRVLGRPLAEARALVAYVPQTDTTDWDFPITVREVVLMGRYPQLGWVGRPKRADWAEVDACLEMVGMSEYGRRHIRQLSGGQQQRVFLARALAQQAEVLLLDEPFAGVDARTEDAIFELMDRCCAAGKTLVVVSHHLQTLDRFHGVALLNRNIIAYGPPAETLTAENLRRVFGGRLTFVDEAERLLREGGRRAD